MLFKLKRLSNDCVLTNEAERLTLCKMLICGVGGEANR